MLLDGEASELRTFSSGFCSSLTIAWEVQTGVHQRIPEVDLTFHRRSLRPSDFSGGGGHEGRSRKGIDLRKPSA